MGGADLSAQWQAAAQRAGIGLTCVAIDEQSHNALYGADLLLVRPDMYVAWRGNAPAGADIPSLLNKALGFE